MDTKQVIAGMLTENTGRHMLDSGGDSGRQWQRNQGRDFAAEEATSLKFEYDYIAMEHNVFHWLVDRLEFSEDMDAEFRTWVETQDKEDGWFQLMQGWVDQLGETCDEDGDSREVGGIYGEGNPLTVNTYNGESLLSQVLQFAYFTMNDTAYVVLQIHGGADVRGGYTAPKVFEICGGSDGTEIFDNARGGIGCSDCDSNWSTDDANSWYNDGACGMGAGTQLEAYDRTKAEDGDEWTEGKLHITADGDMLCPDCGSKLVGGFH
jgi:hypothetical protein